MRSVSYCELCKEESGIMMKTYNARVRVPAPSGAGTVVTLTEINALSPIAAKNLLEALYGRGNVVAVPLLVT